MQLLPHSMIKLCHVWSQLLPHSMIKSCCIISAHTPHCTMTSCRPSPCCTHSIGPTIDCVYHLQEPVNYNILQSGPWPTHPPATLADTTYANTFHMLHAMTSVCFMVCCFLLFLSSHRNHTMKLQNHNLSL